MSVTVTLSTAPGYVTRGNKFTSKTIDIFGPSLGKETLSLVSTVPDIKAAVGRFGAKLRTQHLDASFYVFVHLAKGCRKPNGFDAASNNNGFGQNDFMHVKDEAGNKVRTEPAETA